MTRFALSLLAATALAGCTSNSGVATTPTFTAARFLPPVAQGEPQGIGPSPDAAKRPQAAPQTNQRPFPYATGGRAVDLANRAATVEPSSRTMQGATWVIDDVQPSRIYRVATAPGRVTTILLPAGERFNGAVGGNVEAFLVNVSYAGPRPAVSILPRSEDGTGNLQLVTTAGFYSFDLHVNRYVALNLVDVAREPGAGGAVSSLTDWPQPEGDFTRLAMSAPNGPPPAWLPAEAWADSRKMVVRFNAPLPVLPALFAGQKGEQLVSYRSQLEGQSVLLITSRRVTEAELRLDGEVVRLTVDPAQRADGWQLSGPLPEPAVPPADPARVPLPGPAGLRPAATGGAPPSTTPIAVGSAGGTTRQPPIDATRNHGNGAWM
jgi:hypothetical protein